MKTTQELTNEAKHELKQERDEANRLIEKEIIEEIRAKIQVEELWSKYDLNEDQLNILKSWVSSMRPLRYKRYYETSKENRITEEQSTIIDYGCYLYHLQDEKLPPIEEQINNYPDDYVISLSKGSVKKSEIKSDPEPEPKRKRKLWDRVEDHFGGHATESLFVGTGLVIVFGGTAIILVFSILEYFYRSLR